MLTITPQASEAIAGYSPRKTSLTVRSYASARSRRPASSFRSRTRRSPTIRSSRPTRLRSAWSRPPRRCSTTRNSTPRSSRPRSTSASASRQPERRGFAFWAPAPAATHPDRRSCLAAHSPAGGTKTRRAIVSRPGVRVSRIARPRGATAWARQTEEQGAGDGEMRCLR